jgi:hypothetical protein
MTSLGRRLLSVMVLLAATTMLPRASSSANVLKDTICPQTQACCVSACTSVCSGWKSSVESQSFKGCDGTQKFCCKCKNGSTLSADKVTCKSKEDGEDYEFENPEEGWEEPIPPGLCLDLSS